MESRWSLKRFFRSTYNTRHETKISSWLPPVESWDSGGAGLPYGWEQALDKEGKTYYINHTNKTTTYENPRKETDDEPPQPREVELIRDPQMGFGFVAGSEKPVIVRFVTEGGPNEHKLMPGDQIMKINGEDVLRSPREHVIELIRSCKQTVTLLVCQPHTNNTTRKSALLTAAKKAKLKNNPNRVRFSEGVVINGSPLYSPSPNDSYVPFLPNVLKVFLENGQTKSFKYDSTTTIQDVLKSLQEKLSISCVDHFSLATEHVKITRRNRLTILDPKDTLAKIAAKPGAHHLRCVFRVTFVPRDAYDLLQKDAVAFEYLYLQCCNDVVEERFTPELKYDIALRLTALNIQQHCLSNGMQGKITVKNVERECGIDRFVPVSLLETMKRKELRKLLGHFLKQNQALCAPGQKRMTALQAKLHYLKIISELPSYGSKCFSTNLSDNNPEITLLLSPRFGISQIGNIRNTCPITLSRIEDITEARIKKEDEISCLVELTTKDADRQKLAFSMEEKDAEEFILLLKGYYRLFICKELLIEYDKSNFSQVETVPSFHNRHVVHEAPWSYPPRPNTPGLRTLDLAIPPPIYIPCETLTLCRQSPKQKQAKSVILSPSSVDHNMNETLSQQQEQQEYKSKDLAEEDLRRNSPYRTIIDERHPGIDYQTVISMELLEDSSGDVDVDIYEAKNDEVIKRVSEMNQIISNVESYLSIEHNPEEHANLKAADSLLLLAQSDNTSKIEDIKSIIPEGEISPSESDTDSTPNESPLHRSTPLRSSINGAHSKMRRDSSFGLHSPDLLPNLSSGNNILDILKQLQMEENIPIAEEVICLDPDIIDLTMIPPPITPDMETRTIAGSSPNAPPADFLDSKVFQTEFAKCNVGTRSSTNEDTSKGEIQRHTGQSSSTSPALNHSYPPVDPETMDKTISKLDSIDSFIANLTIPPPPKETEEGYVSNEDISAYIIPPPPSSSPSTEAQNEVIARFMAAADDIKRMFQTEETESSFKELQQFWSEIKSSDRRSQFLLDFDNLSSNTDSGSHSGDSSGYDTLTSSLTSYSDTIVSDDLDGLWNSPSSSDSTPVFERPSDVIGRSNKMGPDGLPVPPTLKTSCVDDVTSPLSITSPSSTTSSDSSVILLDMPGTENNDVSNLTSLELPNLQNPSFTGSCDDLWNNGLNSEPSNIVRSISFTSIADLGNGIKDEPKNDELSENHLHPSRSNFQMNRLRRSFNRGPLKNAVLPKPSNLQPDHTSEVGKRDSGYNGDCSNPGNHINGFTNAFILPKADKQRPDLQSTKDPRVSNGCIPNSKQMNGLSDRNVISGSQSCGPFQQAQKDISAMVMHLKKINLSASKLNEVAIDREKFTIAKDALVNESRQFVTSSKLFVKSAMESSEKMIENMAICVALLNRMTAIGELVVIRSSPGEPVQYLVEKLKEVAVSYFYTVEAAQHAIGTKIDDPKMSVLMQRATTLATALTQLMRTLRAISLL
ncbi:FERM and PDZ domain-containing protein 4 isoform X2 [Parasteatoda tepidariorum]|uniref:FERM and PDZ domain-containing protein 4 isoform X2 n=1 Tax=Parasteatoda tepidariorum TaxID=114398 RepID=UPI001C71C2EF|nr:FERM and PDZ domain-containing protein 4 isoform X2 [Parasteatoda tepidariorum]